MRKASGAEGHTYLVIFSQTYQTETYCKHAGMGEESDRSIRIFDELGLLIVCGWSWERFDHVIEYRIRAHRGRCCGSHDEISSYRTGVAMSS